MPTSRLPKAFQFLVSGFGCQEKREPQNTEQGIMNVEVLMNGKTSDFYIPCSIFDIQRK
jgi:hypothetical protein